MNFLFLTSEFKESFILTCEAYVVDLANSTSLEYRLVASRLLGAVSQPFCFIRYRGWDFDLSYFILVRLLISQVIKSFPLFFS